MEFAKIALGLLILILTVGICFAIMFFCIRSMIRLLSQPTVKWPLIGFLVFFIFFSSQDLFTDFSWGNLGRIIFLVILCVGLFCLKTSESSHPYSKHSHHVDWDDFDDEKPFRTSGKSTKRKPSTYTDDFSDQLRKQKRDIARAQYAMEAQEEAMKRQQEKMEDKKKEREKKQREAALRRGNPVGGGACPYLYSLSTGYYEGWRSYRCDMTGVTFEDTHCKNLCYYSSEYEKNCPYFNN